MKTFSRLVLISLLLIIAAPANAGSGLHALQLFNCEFNDDATADQVLEMASAWLKAARSMNGGENLDVFIRFPVAEGEDFEVDFKFGITTPTFAEWGAFTDAYEGSAAAKVDEEFHNLADCAASSLWEGMKIE